jgi:hypothetical protein
MEETRIQSSQPLDSAWADRDTTKWSLKGTTATATLNHLNMLALRWAAFDWQ